MALAAGLEGSAGPSICVAVPLFHILGLLESFVYLVLASTVCLPKSYRAEELVRMIDAQHVSDMAAVGAVYQGLAEAEGFEERVAPHLRTCMIAGGMTTPVQIMRLELAFTHATFINAYGQSDGAEYVIDKRRDSSMNARIILGAVDNFHTKRVRGKPVYCMDFLYDGYLDIKTFLLSTEEG